MEVQGRSKAFGSNNRVSLRKSQENLDSMRLSVEDPQKLNKDKGMVSNRKHTKIQNFYDQRMESANKEGKHMFFLTN